VVLCRAWYYDIEVTCWKGYQASKDQLLEGLARIRAGRRRRAHGVEDRYCIEFSLRSVLSRQRWIRWLGLLDGTPALA